MAIDSQRVMAELRASESDYLPRILQLPIYLLSPRISNFRVNLSVINVLMSKLVLNELLGQGSNLQLSG